MKENEVFLEATIYDIRFHNSKTDDNSWVDLSLRVYGQAGIDAAMKIHRAKNKTVKIVYEKD